MRLKNLKTELVRYSKKRSIVWAKKDSRIKLQSNLRQIRKLGIVNKVYKIISNLHLLMNKSIIISIM